LQLAEAQLVELVIEGAEADAEQFGGLGAIASRRGEGARDRFAFRGGKGIAERQRLIGRVRW
jgi:hypothetical protein